MPQPHTRIDSSSSNSVASPSFGQSSIRSFSSSAPQSVFNQKLIPRDFLSSRSKPALHVARDSRNENTEITFTHNPFQSNTFTNVGRSRENQDTAQRQPSSLTTKQAAESDAEVQDELRFPRTTPFESKKTALLLRGRSASDTTTSTAEYERIINTIMPRTSSIDSAISNVSNTSLSKATADLRDPSPTSVRNLIASAGGAENLVTLLLKEKNGVASQNAQLWKLLEKQRALIFGLNKDLERLTKERDKYRKRLKDQEIHTINEDGEMRRPTGPLSNSGQSFATNMVPGDREMNPSRPIDESSRAYSNSAAYDYNIQPNVREQGRGLDKENVAAQAHQLILPGLYPEHPKDPMQSWEHSKIETQSATAPALNVIDASPLSERSGKNLASNRKAPPKPLNLAQGKADERVSKQLNAKSEADRNNEEIERGRRRTREEDDRDRELSAMKAEAEARSRSKKNKVQQLYASDEVQPAIQTQPAAPLPTPGLPLSPRPQHAQTFVAPSQHLTAANVPQTASLNERLFAAPLKSPGLPLSPRPPQRNENVPIGLSLPLSPRANMGAFPLSPRAPKHALPAPTTLAAPTDAASLKNKQSRGHQSSPQIPATNLLLPPNALPSIQVKVHSSRLRPSRHTVLSLKNQEETTVFSLSIISRSSNSELWRVEKVPGALPQLEQQLKPRYSNLPKIPDRKLFTGHSPSLLDERRIAIDGYFEELLDIHLDESTAVTICKFLSTDVIDPEHETRSNSISSFEPSARNESQGGPTTKTGYLTKKGKNFGGWKSRFFILEGSALHYYDSPGGPHLGTIRLHNALIGKQKDPDSVEEQEGQFRHAFLIQEPKRKDTGSYVRHVLCAESDAERDDWVSALLYWVEDGRDSRNGSRSERNGSLDINNSESPYQSSKAGPSSKEPRDTHANTPTPTSGSSIDSSILDHISSVKQSSMSGPTDGGVITDATIWSYKPQPIPSSKETRDKTHKMSNIFGFKRPDPIQTQQEQKPAKPRVLRHNGYVRPVFGLPLAEAVEFCGPFNVETDVPAIVYRSIEYLRYRKAANEEGLFRLSGSNVVVRNLKERFNTEGDIDLVHEEEYHDVHAIASLFKTYLRELPSTLLTRDLHIEFIKVLEMENNGDKVSAFNSLVHMLPPANFALLKEMSKYLLEVTGNADKNKMSVRNVGIVFSPTLNIPTPVFNFFLTEFDGIFEGEVREAPKILKSEIQVPLELTPDEIRSPRHQMFSDLSTPAYNQTTFPSHPAVNPLRNTNAGLGEHGFAPFSTIYESGTYVSSPRIAPPQPNKPLTQVSDGGFGSLNGLLVPTNAKSDKARKRNSQMYGPMTDLKLP